MGAAQRRLSFHLLSASAPLHPETPCYICTEPVGDSGERDHFPVSKKDGGLYVAPICYRCHTEKDRSVWDFWTAAHVQGVSESLWGKASPEERMVVAKAVAVVSRLVRGPEEARKERKAAQRVADGRCATCGRDLQSEGPVWNATETRVLFSVFVCQYRNCPDRTLYQGNDDLRRVEVAPLTRRQLAHPSLAYLTSRWKHPTSAEAK